MEKTTAGPEGLCSAVHSPGKNASCLLRVCLQIKGGSGFNHSLGAHRHPGEREGLIASETEKHPGSVRGLRHQVCNVGQERPGTFLPETKNDVWKDVEMAWPITPLFATCLGVGGVGAELSAMFICK